jgi:hypothetical protein
MFNPGRLKDISRATASQWIAPGSNQYDYARTGGQGRKVPAVGAYPSGSPYGLSGALADDSAPPLSPAVAATFVVGVSALLWWLSAFSKRHA